LWDSLSHFLPKDPPYLYAVEVSVEPRYRVSR
jgi:hypothetical protein